MRRSMTERIAAAGGEFATVARSDDGAVSHAVTFGGGTLIGDGPLFIGRLTTIGRHSIVMTPVSIGHDCTIADFVTVHPSAAISGHLNIESGVGAVIVNGPAAKPLRVARGARTDVGAVVTKIGSRRHYGRGQSCPAVACVG